MLVIAIGSAHAQWIFQGDGSEEPGFVPPYKKDDKPKLPPPPPANMSSAETAIPYPGPPAQPQSRSEKKNPPTPPVMFVKIKSQYGIVDWASRPNDLGNLLKSMKDKIDVNFSFEARSFAEVSTDPEKNPMLYRSGHFHFALGPAERKQLREYLLNGGMVIFNTGMGSKPFFDSAMEELTAIFPEIQLQRLAADHPIFHSYYNIDKVQYRSGVRKAGYTSDEPLFYGLTIDCRTVAVISRWCMAIGWDNMEDDSLMGYSQDSAQKLGVNLLSYATAQRAWAKTATHAMKLVDADKTQAGKLSLAQIIYNGEWKTRHIGLPVLLQQFNQRTDIPVKFGFQELRLSDPAIFDAPMLYITGHETFQLSAAEIQNLREYLKKGGFLLAEACCGRRGFNSSFILEMQKVLPEYTLAPIPPESQLYTLPNAIKTVGITPSLSFQLENQTTIPPKLLGIEMDGRYVVIYSPYGMCGGWEMAQNPYAFGYDDAGSLSIGENILMYAITH
jgi:hypothetical protein